MIHLSPPHMSGKELEYIKEVFESNYIAPAGEFIEKFEHSVKNYVKTPHALALINATSAIHLALRVLGVKEGDKVISPTFTFIGGVNPILYQNAEPIFIDSDEFWQIDLNLLEEALKKEKPKAMIVVHLYGQSAKMEEIVYLSKKYKTFLIEDAAEALGGEYNGKKLGTFGDFGVYSFNGNKILTSGGGGVLVSENEEFIKKARHLSTQAKEDYPWYEHHTYGYNYKISNVLAAIGTAQMEVIEKRVKQKREIFKTYKKELGDIMDFMPEYKKSKGNRWLSTGVFKDKDPIKVMEVLRKNEIESRPLWKPMHLQPLFKSAKKYINGISETLFKKGLCLPSGTQMKKKDIRMVCEIIKSV